MQGLPGGHHFYITFRTDHPGVELPQRIRAQYPQEMTIVLQHQFWDLGFNRDTQTIQVGLSFGGVPSKLVIPLDAVVEFADPHIRYGLRFQAAETPAAEAPPPPPAAAANAGTAARGERRRTGSGRQPGRVPSSPALEWHRSATLDVDLRDRSRLLEPQT